MAAIPSGMRTVSAEISPETGAGGFILPNDRVDVVLSARGESGPLRQWRHRQFGNLLANIRVLAIDRPEGKEGQNTAWSPSRNARAETRPRRSPGRQAARCRFVAQHCRRQCGRHQIRRRFQAWRQHQRRSLRRHNPDDDSSKEDGDMKCRKIGDRPDPRGRTSFSAVAA